MDVPESLNRRRVKDTPFVAIQGYEAVDGVPDLVIPLTGQAIGLLSLNSSCTQECSTRVLSRQPLPREAEESVAYLGVLCDCLGPLTIADRVVPLSPAILLTFLTTSSSMSSVMSSLQPPVWSSWQV